MTPWFGECFFISSFLVKRISLKYCVWKMCLKDGRVEEKLVWLLGKMSLLSGIFVMGNENDAKVW